MLHTGGQPQHVLLQQILRTTTHDPTHCIIHVPTLHTKVTAYSPPGTKGKQTPPHHGICNHQPEGRREVGTLCTTLLQGSPSYGTQGSFSDELRRRTARRFSWCRNKKNVRYLTPFLRHEELTSHRLWVRIIMVSLRWNPAKPPHHLCPNWFFNHDAQVKLVRHLLLLCLMVHPAIDLLFLVSELEDTRGLLVQSARPLQQAHPQPRAPPVEPS